MKRRMTNNPFGSRKAPKASLPPASFEIPAADRDETAPTAPIIRRGVQRRPFTALDTIDVIRRMTLEARK